MKALVTGASGFVGFHVAKLCMSRAFNTSLGARRERHVSDFERWMRS